MITLDKNLCLKSIDTSDGDTLFNLMQTIYPPVYGHLWVDNGDSYLQELYSESNLRLELKDPKAYYYFVIFKYKLVGILRVITNTSMPGVMSNSMVKLQRIYLSPKIQGKGIGKHILNWIEETFCKENGAALWLEVMDSQPQAIGFYENMGFIKKDAFAYNSSMMKATYRGMYRMIKRFE
ncbi:GNAT family N-acetyltransferase [Aestuariivivens sediminicola]|uniref:GNAT family N-acetyltransferase n=1 Tax=Aestuariivivens sediminicola TaxID=2913560 RepID=UPI001F55BC36|nr:GNAT family N-acetyltransferase [Aestuariivivens sediminicola]